ncbi:hypothetical protein ACFQ0T_37615 [Kitasatospora gansuensis]
MTAVSESLAAGELSAARALADSLGVTHLAPRTDELGSAGYRANGRDRCYFCKSEVLDVIAAVAHEHGFRQLATGTNADDAVDPFRPGIRAGRERSVLTPLRDTGLSKVDVRAVSLLWSLRTWDKPATPAWPAASATASPSPATAWPGSTAPRWRYGSCSTVPGCAPSRSGYATWATRSGSNSTRRWWIRRRN